MSNNIINIEPVVKEILYYSEKTPDGRYVIPISVDFDFTITSSSDWLSGTINVNNDCITIMKKWKKDFNVGFILNTMRNGDNLNKAINVIKDNGIELYGIGINPLQEKAKELSGKIFSVFDIDDKNVGIPLVCEPNMRPYVDWQKIDKIMSPILNEICRRTNYANV